MTCKYRTEGSDSPPYRMVPMCTCGWRGTVIDGQGPGSMMRSRAQWEAHLNEGRDRSKWFMVEVHDADDRRCFIDVNVEVCPAEPDVGIPREYVDIFGYQPVGNEVPCSEIPEEIVRGAVERALGLQ
jgi:hypothetical protein